MQTCGNLYHSAKIQNNLAQENFCRRENKNGKEKNVENSNPYNVQRNVNDSPYLFIRYCEMLLYSIENQITEFRLCLWILYIQ